MIEKSAVLTNQELYQKIDQGIKPGIENHVILICSIIIASIGLNMNSQPVVIGAMLISPVMNPVQALGFGIGAFDSKLALKALRLLVLEVGFAILAAAFYFFLSPITYASSEIIARTQPTIWDVIIAVFGGFAGIIGVRQREANNIVPGVAIATALMPPLCVMGYSLYEQNWAYFFGSGYLFLINIAFIIITAVITVMILNVSYTKENETVVKKRYFLIIGIALVIAIPSLFSAASLVKKEASQQQAQDFVNQELADSYVLDYTVDVSKQELTVDVIGSNFKDKQIKQLQDKLKSYGLEDFKLQILQLANTPALTLQDVDHYLTEKKAADSHHDQTNKASAGTKLQQEMITMKEQLLKKYPNQITRVDLKIIKSKNGKSEGVLSLTLSSDTANSDKILDDADKLASKSAEKINVILLENG